MTSPAFNTTDIRADLAREVTDQYILIAGEYYLQNHARIDIEDTNYWKLAIDRARERDPTLKNVQMTQHMHSTIRDTLKNEGITLLPGERSPNGRGRPPVDITGLKIKDSILTVLAPTGFKRVSGALWLAECGCGRRITDAVGNLYKRKSCSSKTHRCKAFKALIMGTQPSKHTRRKFRRELAVWKRLRDRSSCYPEWVDNFPQFLEDMRPPDAPVGSCMPYDFKKRVYDEELCAMRDQYMTYRLARNQPDQPHGPRNSYWRPSPRVNYQRKDKVVKNKDTGNEERITNYEFETLMAIRQARQSREQNT